MAIPDVRTLVAPTLHAIGAGISLTTELRKHLADHFQLTPEERDARTGNGQTVFGNRIAFVLRFSGPAGITRKIATGTYELTEAGQALLSRPPEEVADAVLRPTEAVTPQSEQAIAASGAGVPLPADGVLTTPDEKLDAAINELKYGLATELLEAVRQISASNFERLITRLLTAMGYGIPTLHRGGAGDEGIDGIVEADRLGLDRVYVQAKCYAAENTVGPAKIREFVGALTNAGATKGVFVTSSSFSAQPWTPCLRATMRRV